MKTQKSMPTRQRLKELYRVKSKIRYEILGEPDKEYRVELERLIRLVDEAIIECLNKIDKNLP